MVFSIQLQFPLCLSAGEPALPPQYFLVSVYSPILTALPDFPSALGEIQRNFVFKCYPNIYISLYSLVNVKSLPAFFLFK